jgi:hypothetical protein
MRTITLYKYTREGGGVTVSPAKPDGEYTELYRIIADEGKALTQDGVNVVPCADVESVEGWYEVDAPDVDATDKDYQAALEELGVNFDEESDIE